ncbi:hypothetical protein ANN_18659 [Periplaneta americana]|uniref:Uncharacterized protein n=1 Tax=Periplaneta americana TaxID=6978 RepID=A0ABQ8SPC9_PERAM|nr:hypothetical protein ANN_18659 [Periplaneta americana]
MTANVRAVRSIPGRFHDGNLCRRHREIETFAHVLGYCPYGEFLRDNRYNKIISEIASAFKDNRRDDDDDDDDDDDVKVKQRSETARALMKAFYMVNYLRND